jgi:hypothetical protein
MPDKYLDQIRNTFPIAAKPLQAAPLVLIGSVSGNVHRAGKMANRHVACARE